MSGKARNTTNGLVGTVYLVGAGPGDEGLITVKGLHLIRSTEVLVYDYLATPSLLQEASPDAEIIYVGKKGRDHTLEQSDINELLVTKAREGKNVVRLKGGDPFVFGRGGEEAEQLAAAGIPFEIVPGVTSAVAVPAYAGIPVTHRDHASMVTFITGHEDPTKKQTAIDWGNLAGNPGTLVFLMGVKNLPNISTSLIKHGKPGDTPAALVRWGATPDQACLVSTLKEIPKEAKRQGFKPPAVLLVGSVARLRESLNWFEKKPLFGKRILITRSRAQSKKMAEAISAQGGAAVLFPTIVVRPPDNYGPVDRAINDMASYDWVIFTSVNGVERFFARFFELGHDIREMAGPKIGAIGPVTAQSIRHLGMKVDLLAKEFKAEGVLAQLAEEEVQGKRFLIPRAEQAREILPEGIVEMGGEVQVVHVYRTDKPIDSDIQQIRESLEKREIHAITFTSSSTVSHFVEMIGESDVTRLVDGTVLGSIGPITSRTLREKGLPVHFEASEFTIDGLIEALVSHYKEDHTNS